MRNAITIFILLITLACRAATGGVTGIAIKPGGDEAWVYFDGPMATNGVFNYGHSGPGQSNRLTGLEKLVISFDSMGYNKARNPVVWKRKIYGTYKIRFPYPDSPAPNNTFPDTVVTNGQLRATVSLNSWAHLKDSNFVAKVASGLYVAGGVTNNAAASVTVTNLSTQPYPYVVANRTYPCGLWIRTNIMRLRGIGFHGLAEDGEPVIAAEAIVTDQSANSVSDVKNSLCVDWSLPDARHFGEHIWDIPLTSLNNSNLLRLDLVFYPKYGDANSVFDTRLNQYVFPSPVLCATTNFYYTGTNYGPSVAVVSTTGSDTTGKVYSGDVDPASVLSADYFRTPAKASQACRANNNSKFGHDDVGGSIVYLRQGIDDWLGGSQAYGATPKTFITFKPYPNDIVTITNRTGNQDVSDRVWMEDMHFETPGTIANFSGIELLVLNRCTINASTTRLIQASPNTWLLDCAIPQMAQGITPDQSSANTAFLVRGCNLDGFNNQITVWLFVGNSHPNTNGGDYRLQFDFAGQTTPQVNQICYNNGLYGFNTPNVSPVSMGNAAGQTFGAVFANNVVERCPAPSGGSANGLATIGCTINLHYTNFIVWHNVFLGERIAGLGYNDLGTVTSYRWLWSVRNNIWDLVGHKTDLTLLPYSGARVGNWPVMWHVGSWGNAFVECLVNSAAGAFPPEFPGLYGFDPSSLVTGGGTNTIDFVRFRNRKSYDGSGVNRPGGGDYRVFAYSPAHAISSGRSEQWCMKVGAGCEIRGPFSPVGAFARSDPRMSAFF